MQQRIPFEQYFILQALVIAQRSTCNRALVGSVLVKDNRVIASGYNGAVQNRPHCDDVGHLMVDGHCVRTIHSEINALMQCSKNGISTENAEIYVTHFPCLNCTKSLVQAGIKQVNYAYDYHSDPLAVNLLQAMHIKTHQINFETKYLDNLLTELEN